jgi:hypothetical protein
MTKSIPTIATALFFGLIVATGSALAGDSCPKGSKDKGEGDRAAVTAPAKPLV